jgi:phenylalanyl-tRNA synthetase beta chain
MIISYQWLCAYLPETLSPGELSRILTSIGLEVEALEKFQSVKGGLEGVVTGEVLTCVKHPDADKLSVTQVNIGSGAPLQIVCGAPNVAAGQKVLVATVGSTLYPQQGEALTLRKAKIRGVESQGMICAEDELGIGNSHEGILVLPADVQPGLPASGYFNIYEDHIFHIGLTPNRMDAMSHLGVARDICAYLSHHRKKTIRVKATEQAAWPEQLMPAPVKIFVDNPDDCPRYAGIYISDVTVSESPDWLKNRLRSIGLRPLNNVVDITNYILHESGQPLHAFDADKIRGGKVVVQQLPEGTPFTTLDEKERKLRETDLIICDAEGPMCMAGIFGGLNSGVTAHTKNIFLESASFSPVLIRRTSLAHGLRTDAAIRFEKGIDISQVHTVLQRAALLIAETTGGKITSAISDIFPNPPSRKEVTLPFDYLRKLSGKQYDAAEVCGILTALNFEVVRQDESSVTAAVPFSKHDIRIPADLVEEIMRIDGLDNIAIPDLITLAPAKDADQSGRVYREKVSGYLTGLGFQEILTNSITHSAFYPESRQPQLVKMMNSLSSTLDVLRPAMLETGLQSLAHNINRQQPDLQFFEFGKTYSRDSEGRYEECQQLALFITGKQLPEGWKKKTPAADFYYARSLAEKILQLGGGVNLRLHVEAVDDLDTGCRFLFKNKELAVAGSVSAAKRKQFDIKQPVYYLCINWNRYLEMNAAQSIRFREIPRFPAVERDLAIVVDSKLEYAAIEKAAREAKIGQLTSVNLFDVFENEKLGAGKKSMAMSLVFQDPEKTLTDAEIEAMMARITGIFQKQFHAEVRK